MKPVTILFAIVSEGEEEVAFLREDDPSYSFYDEARREFLEKDFTSDILFRIGMESDLRMAGYLARRIGGEHRALGAPRCTCKGQERDAV